MFCVADEANASVRVSVPLMDVAASVAGRDSIVMVDEADVVSTSPVTGAAARSALAGSPSAAMSVQASPSVAGVSYAPGASTSRVEGELFVWLILAGYLCWCGCCSGYVFISIA